MSAASASRPHPLPWFDTTASAPAKLQAVLARPELTWAEYHRIALSVGLRLSRAMRVAIAERLDVMSGAYAATIVTPEGALASVPDLLADLIRPGAQTRLLWSTLWTRATPTGRRRLVDAFGDAMLDYPVGLGSVWVRADWPLLPPLFAPGTLGDGPMDEATGRALLEIFATRIHQGERTSGVPGDLWARAVAACTSPVNQPYLAYLIDSQSPWFLADPARLTGAAVETLLASESAHVRAWALTAVVPRSPGRSVTTPTPGPRTPRRRS